ncbi:putative NAD(P)H nitroreductase [bacterium BMS3Abin07]|nr:putative NAD(P)H nitroreductase [bacterium BMS3Abin07]GBE31611.1 putative NAD(P)H nitroreductase [bacterium BMS3Bbin05]HDO21723.1 nitroreductase [Nitrospirota bacterium]HDZ87895.1 nitroreductase [Nitrospirota bacterium]
MSNEVDTDHPVLEIIASRWSPYSFDGRPVPDEDMLSIFEAARWAPSSYNEQPWHYIIAGKENKEEFETMLLCLVEANQLWAKNAPVLALGITRLSFIRNDKPNRAAIHDLGLASMNLVLEATARGIAVHQMIGIEPGRIRNVYNVPEGFEPVTGLAIGYAASPDRMPEALRERDLTRRTRRPLKEFIFSGKWGQVSGLVK